MDSLILPAFVTNSRHLPLSNAPIGVGNMCKSICGVAAGAVGGVFNLHWAKGSDIADIQAKFSAQHTVTGSLGLIFAALFAKSVSQTSSLRLWSLYLWLTLVHIYANIRCMKLIALESLNMTRMKIVIRQFLRHWTDDIECTPLLSPQEMARKEPLWFCSSVKLPTHYRILFGEAFDQHAARSGLSQTQLLEIVSQYLDTEHYILSANEKTKVVVVSLSADATPSEKVKAYLHAVLLGQALQDDPASARVVASVRLLSSWPALQQSCERAGWDLDKTALNSRGYEIQAA